MAIWEFFKTTTGDDSSSDNIRLKNKIKKLLPDCEEEFLIKYTCIAGLLARVAYVDMVIHDGELEKIKTSLYEWTSLSNEEVNAVVTLALEEIKDLSGLENYKYCRPLNDILNTDQKHELIKTLFAISASDGEVSNQEAEEIRLINSSLRLDQQYFIAAKATVLDKLKALKY